MEYTVRKLGQMAGVSARTLRYYDEIGILKPERVNSSGYRLYGEAQVNRLQQILFYRELGMRLADIETIIDSPSFDPVASLYKHRKELLLRRRRLDTLIANVEKTISAYEGGIKMSDREKFEGFKQRMIDENEARYGKEAREKYGGEAVDRSNRKLKDMTREQYHSLQKLNDEFIETLEEAFKTGDPASEPAQKAADLHRQWLRFFWDSYSKEAHAGLAQMYVDDERFTAYYDRKQPGTAAFLRDAILIYTGMKRTPSGPDTL